MSTAHSDHVAATMPRETDIFSDWRCQAYQNKYIDFFLKNVVFNQQKKQMNIKKPTI